MNGRYPVDFELLELMPNEEMQEHLRQLAIKYPKVPPDYLKGIAGDTDQRRDDLERSSRSKGGRVTAALTKDISSEWTDRVKIAYEQLDPVLKTTPYSVATLYALKAAAPLVNGRKPSDQQLKRAYKRLGIISPRGKLPK